MRKTNVTINLLIEEEPASTEFGYVVLSAHESFEAATTARTERLRFLSRERPEAVIYGENGGEHDEDGCWDISLNIEAVTLVTGAHCDGKSSGKLTIEAPKVSGAILVTYRPFHGRPYTLLVQEVCEMIHARVTKKEMQK